MSYQFQHHYTRDQANALLPQVKQWLARLLSLREQAERYERRVDGLLGQGYDVGGESVNALVKAHSQFREVLREFQSRQIQIKDLDRGLVDFPAIVGGREVYLCWEDCEEEVEFWHDLDGGFAGRERL